ncbi:uncharacterized protein LOC123209369 isoform X1 [Mangifera indica]|uniref:uncharacterized protein LOC123209369 isoform X1 n=2 Tax=Mangifera indica TaxID=29780 RepID=UPI001CF9EA93|nr:uncharacterized protein LOC123209369 isoform X1 [Mangifera indica]
MSAALPVRLFLLPSTLTNSTISAATAATSRPFYSSSDFPSKSLKSPNPNFCYSPSSCVVINHFHYYSCSARRTSNKTWLCGHMKRDQDMDGWREEEENVVGLFGSEENGGTQIPTQAQSLVEGSGAVLVSEFKPTPDVDYLQELLAIQQQGPRAIGFFGTRNMGFMHQELIEILSYALVITKNHIYTSGASGTNAAVIRGALRAEKPELLTVILPQSLKKQPPESQELLSKVKTVIEKPHNDHLPLIEASRLCNMDIISHVQQVICFAFHDSRLLMETCQEAKNLRKIVTLFYLD